MYVMYTLSIQAHYDHISQNYINIIRINMIPEGPLRLFVRRVKMNALSVFQKNNYQDRSMTNNSCIFALVSLNGCDRFMNPNNIPDLFSFLTMNGYKIDTSITKMMNSGDVRLDNQNIICFFSYLGLGK